MTAPGYLALILHAHLPFVRHPEHEEFLEEDWLHEAITETYLPLLDRLHRLADEGVPFRLTFSVTPTLAAMLADPLLQERYTRFIEKLCVLAEKERVRNAKHPVLGELSAFYHERLVWCRDQYVERWQKNLVKAFASLHDRGVVELITCAATHGFLPLMVQYPEAVRAQVRIGCDEFKRHFGFDPDGIWLPECGYVGGLEKVLQEANVRWFVIDSHGLMFGNPRPRFAIYSPCYTTSGPAVFARDRESSRQIWSAEEGYPGDPAYRDFYRDIGFDLDESLLDPVISEGSHRRFTGLKYHRITGRTADKDYYRRSWAMGAMDSHAQNFMVNRTQQIGHLKENLPVSPIVVSPFDAELFGHWWYEGPEFLDMAIRKCVYDQDVFQLCTPGDYLKTHPTLQVMAPSDSSWGHKGYWEVWLDESNAWIYPHLHMAAKRMIEAATASVDTEDAFVERLLRQMARELLLAQSSDWAFLMKTGTAKEYATRRTKSHVVRFTRLYDQWVQGGQDTKLLEQYEAADNLFPELNWRYYASARS